MQMFVNVFGVKAEKRCSCVVAQIGVRSDTKDLAEPFADKLGPARMRG